ncbi:MAG: polysaccharide biosynthesis C-terminal domain-containing protein [Christensenellales bacterium]
MRVMAMALFFLMVTQTCTGILQGMERQHVPLWNLLLGLIGKAIVSAVLLKIPSLNVVGAALGTLICFALLAVLDLWQVIRELRVRFSFYEIFGKPALAALGMTAVVILTMWALSSTPGWVLFILSTLVGIFIYAALVVGFHVVTPQDLRMLPGGTRLDFWLREKGIWR